ncbi:MAG: glycosyltransferase family 4 protein [Chloroflexota bacterium]
MHILMIADVDLKVEPNHRFFNVVRYVASHADTVEFVSFRNLYGGEPTHLLKKIWYSLANLLFDRRQQWQEGNVHYTVIRRLKLPMALRNLLNEFWTYLNLPNSIKHGRYDACIHSHPHNALIVRCMQRHGAYDQVYYDDCDYFGDGPDAIGPLSRQVLLWKEKRAIKGADTVFSVSQPLAILRRSMGTNRVMVSPNGTPVRHFAAARDKRPHPPTLVYIGLLADGWLLAPVIDAMPRIRASIPDAQLLIIGYGADRTRLEAQVDDRGLTNCVTFTGRQPYTALPDLLRGADVALAILTDRPFNRYACHLKLREYIAAGLPVITSPIGDAAVLVEQSRTGILLTDDEPDSIAEAALRLLQDHDFYAYCAENARAYAANLDWHMTLAPIVEQLRANSTRTERDENSLSFEPTAGKS